MNLSSNRYYFISILVFIIFFFSFSKNELAAQDNTVIVGADFDYPPYSFVDVNGHPAGHDIDVMDELAKIIGFSVDYKMNHWDSTLNALENGAIDVITCIVYSAEREKKFDFTIPLHTEYYAIFSRKEVEINDVSDLISKRVIVLEGDIANNKFLKPMGLYDTNFKVKSLPEAILWLEEGKGDFVIAPFPLGMEVIRKHKCKNVQVKGPPVLPSVYCLAVPKGNARILAQLNDGISTMQKTGKLNDIHEKWVKYKRKDERYQSFFMYALWGVAILGIFLAVLMLRWLVLRQQLGKHKEKIQEAEGIYENVFNSMMDALIILSPDGYVVGANPMALKLYDKTDKEFIGMHGRDIIDAENISEFESFFSDTNKGKVFMRNAVKKRKGDSILYLSIKGSLLQYNGEEHHMAIIRDVTEEINSSLNTKKAITEIESTNRTKSAFLSTMSHEIRTPLNAIIGFSRLLSNTDLTVKQEDYNQKIGVSGQLLLELVTDVLDVTKIEAGKMDLDTTPFRLEDLFKKIMDVQGMKAENKGLDFELTISENVPKILIGDSLRLSQVILNLVSNSVKFTEKGSVLVLVRKGKEIEKDGVLHERIWVTVKDTGIGISKEKIKTLFVPFTQSDTSNTRKYGGTGLGLTISKHLVGLMGGELYVESKEGSGTIFSFFVNLKKANEKEFASPRGDAIAGEGASDVLQSVRLLLVEDNLFNAQIYKEQLTSYGCQVLNAYNSEEAFDLLVANEFDIILMDIELPDLDGFETAKRIKQFARWNRMPIVALSAYDSIEEKEKALKIGMEDYLSKPVAISTLVSTIIRYTQKPTKLVSESDVMEFSGLNHFAGNKRLFGRALHRFYSVYEHCPQKIEALIKEKNYKEIKTIVHNLKSGAGMIGVEVLDKLVREIDLDMKNDVPLEALKLEGLILLLKQTLINLHLKISE